MQDQKGRRHSQVRVWEANSAQRGFEQQTQEAAQHLKVALRLSLSCLCLLKQSECFCLRGVCHNLLKSIHQMLGDFNAARE